MDIAMAEKNTADIGFENKYGMLRVCCEATWMHQNIKVLCLD